MSKKIALSLLLCVALAVQICSAQKFVLFPPEMKTAYPSVVYDFLERYLFEIDSLQKKHIAVDQRLRDDKVLFVTGNASSATHITQEMTFTISKTEDKFYEVSWSDTLGNVVLDLAFPMQYELLLGQPKVDIEKTFNTTLAESSLYNCYLVDRQYLHEQPDSIYTNQNVQYLYVESFNDATYYRLSQTDSLLPIFDDSDKWRSAANLFQSCLDSTCIAGYTLYIEQNLYGLAKKQYSIPLWQWLAYCQAMKLKVYFAIEEEREDGLKALLIAQSKDLGFNHMLSIIIPDNFVSNPRSVFKATLNAYIPTHNVKDLYQQYIKKPKKKI
ncbi:MAG: hypothetical protein J6X27_01640 [Bacteroidaceae bacterium]|nr:hypothetical protein [Bacteroidaceae bacterium]